MASAAQGAAGEEIPCKPHTFSLPDSELEHLLGASAVSTSHPRQQCWGNPSTLAAPAPEHLPSLPHAALTEAHKTGERSNSPPRALPCPSPAGSSYLSSSTRTLHARSRRGQ